MVFVTHSKCSRSKLTQCWACKAQRKPEQPTPEGVLLPSSWVWTNLGWLSPLLRKPLKYQRLFKGWLMLGGLSFCLIFLLVLFFPFILKTWWKYAEVLIFCFSSHLSFDRPTCDPYLRALSLLVGASSFRQSIKHAGVRARANLQGHPRKIAACSSHLSYRMPYVEYFMV